MLYGKKGAQYADYGMALDIQHIRAAFPALAPRTGTSAPITYFDAAAQTPIVHDAVNTERKFEENRANVHRGMYALAEEATRMYENARNVVQRFIDAQNTLEIVFTKNATEGINLVARSWGEQYVRKGDVVAISMLEHHSNIVPWMQLAKRIDASIVWIPCDTKGTLDIDRYKKLLEEKPVKVVALTGQSNVLGVRPPLKHMIEMAHEHNAIVVMDASQLAAHTPIRMQEINCDFCVFSGHKIFGPTGIGVLYGKEALLQEMPPFLGGGTMIRSVKQDGFTAADIPLRFEAGTPPAAQAAGLAAALQWLGTHEWEAIEQHETALLNRARCSLESIREVQILSPQNASGCLSFTVEKVHPHDIAALLGQNGICVRAGHHCAQPLHDRLGVPGSVRISVSIFNTAEEVDRIAPALQKAISFLSKPQS